MDQNVDRTLGLLWRRTLGTPQGSRGPKQRVSVDEVVSTTVSSSAPGGWVGTTIAFDLRAKGSDTLLSFAHRGFEQANEGYARVTSGWGYFLGSLQLYLEKRKGHTPLMNLPCLPAAPHMASCAARRPTFKWGEVNHAQYGCAARERHIGL